MPLPGPSILSAEMIRPGAPRLRQPLPFQTETSRGESTIELEDLMPEGGRRCRIWDLAGTLHCSVIGTCLTTSELRHILIKLKIKDAETSSDHDVHTMGVMLAGNRDTGGRLLQKALDRRHKATIVRFAKAKSTAALLALWEESLAQGEIPGAYWAAMTHPETTDDVIRHIFGAVHMLSHMVGAANRADIRRLRQLEDDNAALHEKIERQQRQLRDGFTARDAKIRQLNDLVARDVRAPEATPADNDTHDEAQRQLIADLSRRLEQETLRRERAERRLEAVAASRQSADKLLEHTARECDALRTELASVEAHIAVFAQPETASARVPQLSGAAILYVGGRHHQVAQLRALVEQAGGSFLHHDGGVENSLTTLPGLVSRASRVVFPVDCVSHSAVATVKRLCRQTEKPYTPLRNASLTSLLTALGGNTNPASEMIAAE